MRIQLPELEKTETVISERRSRKEGSIAKQPTQHDAGSEEDVPSIHEIHSTTQECINQPICFFFTRKLVDGKQQHTHDKGRRRRLGESRNLKKEDGSKEAYSII